MTTQTDLISCEICKAPMIQELQDYVVDFEGQSLIVEEVPIWVCERCSYTFVEPEVIEAIEDMLAHMDTVVSDDDG